jgi:hypothetical protein
MELFDAVQASAMSGATLHQIQTCLQRGIVVPVVPASRRGVPNKFNREQVEIFAKYAEAMTQRKQLTAKFFPKEQENMPAQKKNGHARPIVTVQFPQVMTPEQRDAVRDDIIRQVGDDVTVLVLSGGGYISPVIIGGK